LPNPRRWSASRPTGYILGHASVIRARMPEVPAGNPPPCGWPETRVSFWAQLPDLLRQVRR